MLTLKRADRTKFFSIFNFGMSFNVLLYELLVFRTLTIMVEDCMLQLY